MPNAFRTPEMFELRKKLIKISVEQDTANRRQVLSVEPSKVLLRFTGHTFNTPNTEDYERNQYLEKEIYMAAGGLLEINPFRFREVPDLGFRVTPENGLQCVQISGLLEELVSRGYTVVDAFNKKSIKGKDTGTLVFSKTKSAIVTLNRTDVAMLMAQAAGFLNTKFGYAHIWANRNICRKVELANGVPIEHEFTVDGEAYVISNERIDTINLANKCDDEPVILRMDGNNYVWSNPAKPAQQPRQSDRRDDGRKPHNSQPRHHGDKGKYRGNGNRNHKK